MTHGGGGALYLLLILLLVSLPVTLIWLFHGQGNARKRRAIGFSQIGIFAIAIILFFSGVSYLQNIGLVAGFIVLITMLITPVVFKNRM